MNLEDQVCSLELAKKLKELGIEQKSYFYWWVLDKDHPLFKVHEKTKTEEVLKLSLNGKIMIGEDIHKNILGEFIHYSAFTSAELGNILPNGVILKEGEPFNSFRISLLKFISVENSNPINNWIINYECDSTEFSGEDAWLRRRLTSNIYDPNLSNAMAKMIIYLLENNIIDIGLIRND